MSVKVTRDNVAMVLESIKQLAGQEVLVGIPATQAERSDGDSSPLNNAQLVYIHENGSPARNIPARPFLVPGIDEQLQSIRPHLQKAASAAMDGNADRVQVELNAAGLIAADGARHKINFGDFEPLSPETVRNRHRSRGTQSMREAERQYLDLIAQGSAPEQAQSETGIRPLINTGQLRNSITYVIRKKR
ncbi:hypothetical protein SAMN04244579_02714 [Azotobacter beijerinckii]|uniref:Uncharacterized protein n=1 Tax=Azotobacter beijerinckii TaxID=170623 RepID=A0A1H6VEZ2_9GAMM|nr:hypothetical protein [Azotobacter beijerinckii]SEI98862.1 hypothetical protein SAMN04244579_02714 [Azotobacter beijerinckii]